MNGTNWRDFVDSMHEIDTYKRSKNKEPTPFKSKAQKQYKAQRKKNDIYSSPAGHKNLSTGAPFTNKSQRAGTDRLRFEEDVDPRSFEMNEELEPQIWEDELLKKEISQKLLKIAFDFIGELPVEVEVGDITLTGSLANYNWSNYSDVDLHIIVDFLTVDENRELVKSFFDNARMKWNNQHDITIKGYDVEIYVEDSRESHKSSGVYSILNDEWVVRPRKFESNIDFNSARKKSEDIEFQVNVISNLITVGKNNLAIKNIKRLKQKIKNMRRAGLESPKQEFSVENIAFKILRRNGTLGILNDLKLKAYDDMMSVKEEDEVHRH